MLAMFTPFPLLICISKSSYCLKKYGYVGLILGGREAYKREWKVMKWEQCTDMKCLLLVGRTGGWKPGIIGCRRGLACNLRKTEGSPVQCTDMKSLLLVGRTGGWEPGIIGGRRGLGCALRKNWMGVQHDALTRKVYSLWGRTGGWKPGMRGGRKGLRRQETKGWEVGHYNQCKMHLILSYIAKW